MEKACRTACRSQLTKLIKTAEDVLNNEPENIDKLEVFKIRVKEASDKLGSANEKYMETLRDSDETALSAEWVSILDYNDSAVKILAELEVAIRRASPARNEQQINETGAPQEIPQCSRKMSVRLPKIELKKFNGDLHQWAMFWEQYSTAIHDNNELDENAKFSYLKTMLTGKAAVTIQGLTPSQACYQDAIELLKTEFGNPEKLIDTYIQTLLALQPVKNRGDNLSLRKLYNTTTTITKSLQSLGIHPNQYGMMLKSVILKAIPYAMRVDFNKYVINKNDSSSETGSVISAQQTEPEISYDDQIAKLLNFLKVEIESVEQAQSIVPDNEKQRKPSEYKYYKTLNKPKDQENLFTAAGLLTPVEEKCLFCSRDHETINCKSNLTLKQKKDILKSKDCCFRCTKFNHSSRFCKTRNLKCIKCGKRHATTLCDPNYINSNEISKQNLRDKDNHVNGNGKDEASASSSLFINENLSNVYLQTATAYIMNNTRNSDAREALIRLIFDSGSQTTFVKETVSKKLKLKVVGTCNISIMPFGSANVAPAKPCRCVRFQLKAKDGDNVIDITAVEVPEICFDSFHPPSVRDPIIASFAKHFSLADTHIDQRDFDGISLLIGADNYWKIVTGETEKLTDSLSAVNTKIGWTILGADRHNELSASLNLSNVLHVQDSVEDINVQRFWDLDSIGIASDTAVAKNSTSQFIDEKIKLVNDRYEVCLPWVNENVRLDTNYDGAFSRFKSLVNKLIKNSKLLEYDIAMKEYFINDCAERAPKDINERVYYMPHRPIYRDEKDTSKIRIVFDASAHARGLPSLNELLDSGENLVPELLRVLMNFRVGKIGLTADIEKAFLQVSLDERERDCHRFLWFAESLTGEANLPDIAEFRMKRVTFGVTCSPFLLAATLTKHLSSQPEKDICNILQRSFYVDDLLVACNTPKDAEQLYVDSKDIMARANMNLRKWNTNDKTLKGILKYEDQNEEPINNKKILGIYWCSCTDELSVDLLPALSDLSNQTATKRNVLSSMSKIYDPLGFIAPFTVRAKILIQQVWKEKLEWDTPLTPDLSSDWRKWGIELALLADITFPRCVTEEVTKDTELHIFADASPQAYGTVAYIKGNGKSHFLISKNRIAPLNNKEKSSLTLPKLELTAALCAARLQDYIIRNLNVHIEKIYLWTDSKIALAWIRGRPSKWKPYISNRVTDIQNLTKGEWRHCPGTDNPADLLTRGVKAKTLLESELWKFGPKWLIKDKEVWPKENTEESVVPTQVAIFLNITEPQTTNKEPLLSIEAYSRLERVLRVTAYVIRFVSNLKTPLEKEVGRLTASELKEALKYWIKYEQNLAFGSEVKRLKNNDKITSVSGILSLSPQMDDDGILRVGGRLQHSVLSYDTKHPVLLPRKSHLGDLLIWSCHLSMAHGGINATLSQLRKTIWMIKGRQRIKGIIGKCVTCKKLKGKAGSQPFAPLPRDRVTEANPFKVTGVDFAGPLYLPTNDHHKSKVYIMLLTCAVVRAVHLELVPDLTTESCIRALRRFFARRGVPDVIYSDNAKTFKRTSRELQVLISYLNENEIQDMCCHLRIEWKFIVERAAWWGGFWERMVKTVKSALKAVLGKSTITYDELQTVLTEVEAIVNSRPLTYIDNDPENLILTPSHFLIGNSSNSLKVDIDRTASKNNDILNLWSTRATVMKRFWKIWSSSYLQQLRSAHHNVNSLSLDVFKVGSVALLHDQNVPRQLWKLVRVEEVYPGRDGRVRACRIRTSNGTIMKRPIQLFFPLEIEPAGEDVENIP